MSIIQYSYYYWSIKDVVAITVCAAIIIKYPLAMQTKLTFANPIAVMDIARLERTRSLLQLNVCRTARLCRRSALH
jgi:hypothetical protein